MSLLICQIFKKIPKNIACDFGSLFGVGLICSGGVGVCLVGCILGQGHPKLFGGSSQIINWGIFFLIIKY